MRRITLWLGLLMALLPVRGVLAHEVRPGFLELREVAPKVFLMTWKVPALGDFRLGIAPLLPGVCHVLGQPISMQAGGAFVERSRIDCDRGLEGQRIAVDRLGATATDVLVRIESADGGVLNARLTPSSPSLTVPTHPGAMMVARTYVGLGVEHILFGVDHLLFVLCLLLLVRDLGKLLATVTAFTLAHSITLAATTLGYVHVPPLQSRRRLHSASCSSRANWFAARPDAAGPRSHIRGSWRSVSDSCTGLALRARWPRSGCRNERYPWPCSHSISASSSGNSPSSPPFCR
jgi:hypothetical protein